MIVNGCPAHILEISPPVGAGREERHGSAAAGIAQPAKMIVNGCPAHILEISPPVGAGREERHGSAAAGIAQPAKMIVNGCPAHILEISPPVGAGREERHGSAAAGIAQPVWINVSGRGCWSNSRFPVIAPAAPLQSAILSDNRAGGTVWFFCRQRSVGTSKMAGWKVHQPALRKTTADARGDRVNQAVFPSPRRGEGGECGTFAG